jgi:uncharacterized protein involved in copper resistance
MTPTDQQLTQLLREADAMSTPPVTMPLDAGRLLATVAERRRSRTATRTVLVATVMVALIASVRLWPSSTEQVATAAAEETTMEELAAAIAEIESEVAQLQAQIADSPAPTYDLISAMKHSSHNDPAYREKLRIELAELENHAAASDAALAWERAWFRSGALRLELARQDAKIAPDRAADSYRQIAKSYAGTPWGDEARLALTNFATQ